jgi:hypothetical protein
MKSVGKVYDHLVYFIAIEYLLGSFGIEFWVFCIYFPVLVYCTKKNLATLNSCYIWLQKFGNLWFDQKLVSRGMTNGDAGNQGDQIGRIFD